MCVSIPTAVITFFFFFKQKTAYEIGTGDWSSDVCSSDLGQTADAKAYGEVARKINWFATVLIIIDTLLPLVVDRKSVV